MESEEFSKIDKTLKEFLQKLTVVNNNEKNNVLKEVNKDLEIFLEAHSNEEEDGFLESLKQCNRSGSWYNAEFLERVIHHFQKKWGTKNTCKVYPH
ncbi:MAG: hypothetical protein DI598_10110 [Pseudopedobacter saltans]|uniref:Hemerythrin-like domain-containing protein n=1 Tax=Pseudopedobacter saltans TaxID=151895 RepID=A0A2W5EWG9_9SPHI|nr:MAG: hypothetical protein DI598_10110 [Pseudopedobacter saltans]